MAPDEANMRFPFNDRKTAQAAAHLLALNGGPLSYMVLIKLLYLADRATLLEVGQPITGDRLVAMKHGPVLSRVLEMINEGDEPGGKSVWSDYVSPPSGYDVALRIAKPSTDELSRYELRTLGKVFETYGHIPKWDLVKLLHRILPEWSDPGASSRPIDPADILRAESRSEEEIQRINDVSADLVFLGQPA